MTQRLDYTAIAPSRHKGTLQCLWLHCAVGPAQAAGESGLSARLADQRLRLLHRYALA